MKKILLFILILFPSWLNAQEYYYYYDEKKVHF